MINWKNLYIGLGVGLGGIGILAMSGELLILSVAFIGSAALQLWLGHRANETPPHVTGPDNLLAGKP